MLKYFKDNYEEGRRPIDLSILEGIFAETMKIASPNVDISTVDVCKSVRLFLASLSYYFHLHPEQYVDFGKFVAYRNIDKNNMWTVEAKAGESADSIYQYMKNGGIEIDELRSMIKQYSSDLLMYSKEQIDNLSDSMEKINELVSQDEIHGNNQI